MKPASGKNRCGSITGSFEQSESGMITLKLNLPKRLTSILYRQSSELRAVVAYPLAGETFTIDFSKAPLFLEASPTKLRIVF